MITTNEQNKNANEDSNKEKINEDREEILEYQAIILDRGKRKDNINLKMRCCMIITGARAMVMGLMEQGVDDKGKYYKVYYNEES